MSDWAHLLHPALLEIEETQHKILAALKALLEQGDNQSRQLAVLHERLAQQMLEICLKNDANAQFVSGLVKQFSDTVSALLDQALKLQTVSKNSGGTIQ